MDAGGLAHMTYSNNNNGFPSNHGLGAPGSGFAGGRSRMNSKRLSVALPPKINSIDEHQVDNPTPRTSRSHLLAGLRTQPKLPAQPASAPFHQTQHQMPAAAGSKWTDNGYHGYEHNIPQSAMGNGFDMVNQYAPTAGRQMYSLPDQVLAPPSLNDHGEEMDPAVLQQMQMTSLYLAQRQQQLQQQLANITAVASGLHLNGTAPRNPYQQNMMAPQYGQNQYGQPQQQIHSPMEVPGQPGVYLVFNPSTQTYNYVFDQQAQQQAMSPSQQPSAYGYFNDSSVATGVSPPATERSTPTNTRSFTPPKKAPSPPFASDKPVEPLPPPSSNAFRRGHNKSLSSLSISKNVADGPKTSSTATFGSQRTVFPPTPMTGTFQPGAARAGEHPVRQPRGPPPLEELVAAPTSTHEGSKNFAARQRRRAVDSLMKAGIGRRGVSRSSNGSPVSERDFHLGSAADDDYKSFGASSSHSRKMSPIGSEMKEKRGSHGSAGSDGGYFGLSSASSSSEGEDAGAFKLPPTPAGERELLSVTSPVSAPAPVERKKMVLNVLHAANAAEKRRVGGTVGVSAWS